MANADTSTDAAQAIAMGSEGIGLCRTEHMFLDPRRLPAVRKMLLNAETAKEWRREHPEKADGTIDTTGLPEGVRDFYQALAEVRQLQTDDFTSILRSWSTVR
jgi:phosphoenolpyruvate synthase/pyruvate phosphate dikinase